MVAETRSRTQRSSRVAPCPCDVEEETSLIDQECVKVVNKRDRLVSILEPGDHIAAKRKEGLYEHHGIYEGEEKGYPSVIHFQGSGKPSDNSSGTCNTCRYEHPKKAKVVTSCIDCFSKGNRMYKLQYKLQHKYLTPKDRDSNGLKHGKLIRGYRSKTKYLEYYKGKELYGHSRYASKKRGFIRSFMHRSEDTPYEDIPYKGIPYDHQVRFYKKLSSRSSEQVLNKARKLISKGKGYNLLCNNCEHIAVLCKTGNSMSKQVKDKCASALCKVPKLLCWSATTESSDSENESKNPKPVAKESEKDEDEGKGLLDSGNARKRTRLN